MEEKDFGDIPYTIINDNGKWSYNSFYWKILRIEMQK